MVQNFLILHGSIEAFFIRNFLKEIRWFIVSRAFFQSADRERGGGGGGEDFVCLTDLKLFYGGGIWTAKISLLKCRNVRRHKFCQKI